LLQREVRDWEPGEALFGGGDGLAFYRRLLADTPQILKVDGYLVLEIGFSQIDSISEMVKDTAFRLLDITQDLQDIPRTLCLRRTV
jgi:release factor glutamine methyltransferase